MARITLVLICALLSAQISAFSLQQKLPLQNLIDVQDLSYRFTGDALTVDISLEHDHSPPRLFQRSKAAPLNSSVSSESLLGGILFSSEPVFDWLAKASDDSNEQVLDQQAGERYRLVLNLDKSLPDTETLILADDGSLKHYPELSSHSYSGKAYRSEGGKFHEVGWASAVSDSNRQLAHASWKVNDQAHIGHVPSVYNLEPIKSLRRTFRFDSEQQLLLQKTHHSHVVYRDSDFYDVHNDPLNTDPLFENVLFRRSDDTNGGTNYTAGSDLAQYINDTSGCPQHRKIALIGVAGDCNFVNSFNSTSDAHAHIVQVVNSASIVYKNSFNITLGLASIVLSNDTTCAASSAEWNTLCSNEGSSSGITDRLSQFSQWRGERAEDGYATWTLFTNCDFGSVVGLSWLGRVCMGTASEQSANQFVSGVNVVTHTTLDWKVMAHEIGHSFGAVHDCVSDTCSQNLENNGQCCPLSKNTCDADGNFLMNPASSDNQDSFSPCTIGNICNQMGAGWVNASCLVDNSNVHLVTENQCGNGIVEDGEECDCGGEEGCGSDSCCDPTTCRFKDGAQCDDQNDACCSGCKFASTSTICRASTGPCDPAEHCTGNSSTCPADVHTPDGQSCTIANSSWTGLTCISGHCSSRDYQCVTLYSNSSVSVTSDGQALNFSGACSNTQSSCQLSCIDPRQGRNACFVTSQSFMDGTPCGSGGTCRSGVCRGSSGGSFNGGGGLFGDSGSWLDGRYWIFGVIFGGIIVLLALFALLRRCFWSRKAPKAQVLTGPVAPQMYSRYGSNRGEPYYGGGTYPVPPPPAFSNYDRHAGSHFSPPAGPPPGSARQPSQHDSLYSYTPPYSPPPLPPRSFH